MMNAHGNSHGCIESRENQVAVNGEKREYCKKRLNWLVCFRRDQVELEKGAWCDKQDMRHHVRQHAPSRSGKGLIQWIGLRVTRGRRLFNSIVGWASQLVTIRDNAAIHNRLCKQKIHHERLSSPNMRSRRGKEATRHETYIPGQAVFRVGRICLLRCVTRQPANIGWTTIGY